MRPAHPRGVDSYQPSNQPSNQPTIQPDNQRAIRPDNAHTYDRYVWQMNSLVAAGHDDAIQELARERENHDSSGRERFWTALAAPPRL
jgi:hypothetical protein